MSNLLTAALAYARRGWRVFPLHSPAPTATGCSCSRKKCDDVGKHPRTEHGLHDATTDEAQIRAWWGKWPDANIGIRTGAVSAMFVVDVDDGGAESLGALEAELGPLPDTLTVGTSGGGFHLYFRHPGGEVPNHNPGKRPGKLGLGVDIRGDGGYVVAPPSLHRSGARYAVLKDLPIADAPSWVIDRVQDGRDAIGSVESVESVGSVGRPSTDSMASDTTMTLADAVQRCIVRERGTHDDQTLRLARLLKFCCGVRHPSDPLANVAFKMWWPPSKPNCGDQDDVNAFDKFQRALINAVIPPDAADLFAAAWQVVGDGPYGDGIDELPGPPELQRLAAAFRELGRTHRLTTFFCSCYQIAAVLGTQDPKRGDRMRKSLVRMGVVECVDPGFANRGGKGAARYRWIGTAHLREPPA